MSTTRSRIIGKLSRAAIVNTCVIAYGQGKVALPPEPELDEDGGDPFDDVHAPDTDVSPF